MHKRILESTTTPQMKRKLLWVFHRMIGSVVRLRMATGQLGPFPNFIVIGAQKGGTTYLYSELTKHPCIAEALTKEVHFYDDNWRRGLTAYRAYFPVRVDGQAVGHLNVITGEASPCYIFHPRVPNRVAATLPNVKLIVLLRNPVSRAYSHYHHELRLGFETLSFQAAIEQEEFRLAGEREKMLQDENYPGNNYMHYSYLARGIYVDQLKAWLELFPRDQILILKSEDFYRDTRTTMHRVTEFLGVPSWEPEQYSSHESTGYAKMVPSMKSYLADYFMPHNRRLYNYLGIDFDWDN